MASAVPAHAGLVFNITYSNAVQSNANFANIQTAVNFVKAEFSGLYSDNVTLNFTIDQSSSGLGSSLFSLAYWRGDYGTLRTALVNDKKTPDDNTATAAANLPLAAPYGDDCTSGLGNCWYAPSAEAKALGLLAGNNAASDGTYTFNSTLAYTYDPNNRQVSSKYDFIGVTEHEFSELMGRTQQSAAFGYNILDTMRFTAPAARTRDLTLSNVKFSFDNGNTPLATYNSGSGDKQDFDGTVATDPFNASTGTNQGHLLNSVDKREMDVIGWDLVAPEPGMLLPAVAGLGLILLGRRRRKI